MAVGDAYVFPGFLTPVLTQLFFQKPPTTFLTCFCRDERRKYAGKKSRLNWGSNSQPLGNESDTLNTEPPGRGPYCWDNLRQLRLSYYAPPSTEWGYIALQMSVGPSVGRSVGPSVGRVGRPYLVRMIRMITRHRIGLDSSNLAQTLVLESR